MLLKFSWCDKYNAFLWFSPNYLMEKCNSQFLLSNWCRMHPHQPASHHSPRSWPCFQISTTCQCSAIQWLGIERVTNAQSWGEKQEPENLISPIFGGKANKSKICWRNKEVQQCSQFFRWAQVQVSGVRQQIQVYGCRWQNLSFGR